MLQTKADETGKTDRLPMTSAPLPLAFRVPPIWGFGVQDSSLSKALGVQSKSIT